MAGRADVSVHQYADALIVDVSRGRRRRRGASTGGDPHPTRRHAEQCWCAPFGKRAVQTVLSVPVDGQAGVAPDATAVAVNVTVTEPDGPGYPTVHPFGESPPLASNLNFESAGTVAGLAIVRVGQGVPCASRATRRHTSSSISPSGIPQSPDRAGQCGSHWSQVVVRNGAIELGRSARHGGPRLDRPAEQVLPKVGASIAEQIDERRNVEEGRRAMGVDIGGEVVRNVEAAELQEMNEFVTCVLSVVAAIYAMTGIRVVQVCSGHDSRDVFQSSDVRSGDDELTVGSQNTVYLG